MADGPAGNGNGTRLIAFVRTPIVRSIILFALDSAAWAIGLTAAAAARFEFDFSKIDWAGLIGVLAVVATAQLLWGLFVGLYPGRWRLGSLNEAASLIGGSLVIGFGLIAWLSQISGARPVPLSTVGGGTLFVIISLSTRLVVRMVRDTRQVTNHTRTRRALFFGAGEGGHEALWAILRDPNSEMKPLAFLDDDPAKHRLRIHGCPVVGNRGDIATAALRYRADTLVIAMPSAPRADVAAVAKAARAAGLAVLILPRVTQTLSAAISLRHIRPLEFADFLGRDPVALDRVGMARLVKDRRVLVTGAGGSIGTELCAAIKAFDPATLVMLDRDESALLNVKLRLDGRASLDTADLVVADIRDARALHRVFETHRPEVVFHTAALKHVPLLELYPLEAYKTNVLGTANLLELARLFGVERFINISTDKAADPVNVLGLTKRVGEMMTADHSRNGMKAISVRFGNVLGSNGSVIPTLRKQILDGGPVTITHPDVSRYFMTIHEAVQLVLQAGAVGESGQVLVLDMGSPIRIVDLAQELIAELSPDSDIEVVFTALRAGEKLHEILAGPADEMLGRPHDGITSYSVPPLSPRAVDALETDNPTLLRERLRTIVNEYSPVVGYTLLKVPDDLG
jgi:FlaA1/EpsC-like NDP-sugar epimerase